MGVMRTPSARSSQSIDSDHSGDEDTHSFLRRGSSKRRRPPNHNADTGSLQKIRLRVRRPEGGYVNDSYSNDEEEESMIDELNKPIFIVTQHYQSLDKRDFSRGLRPEHAGAPLSRTASESSQLGIRTPSIPTTPVSPRSPIMHHRSPFGSPSTSPLPYRRSQSPRRGPIDVGFASAVANICEQAHSIAESERRRHKPLRAEDSISIPNSPQLRPSRPRVKRPPLMSQTNVMGSPLPSPHVKHEMYRSTSLETRSRTPSPNGTPSSTPMNEYYGGSNLTDRSRSPSPSISSPVNTPPKRANRKLPIAPTQPTKPSSLNLAQPKLKENMPRVMPSPTIPQPSKSPGSINFPRLNASPTHKPKLNIAVLPHNVPPPGKMGRPEPYSPTERNNLNKISDPREMPGQTRSLPGHYSRRPNVKDNVTASDMYRHASRSPDIGRMRSVERTRQTSRNSDDSNRSPVHVASGSRVRGGERSGRSQGNGNPMHPPTGPVPRSPRPGGNNVQNGYKHRSGRPHEKMELRCDSNAPVTHNSDDDDDDWC